MKKNIEKHLIGVYKTLRTKIDYINNSIEHNLTKGQENEIIIQQLLSDFLPRGKYDLSSGIIIGTNDTISKQNDIVILDNRQPNYTFSRDSRIHLADHVLATIEVKTTFTRNTLKEALRNIATVKSLKTKRKNWSELKMVYEKESPRSFEFVDYEDLPPLGIIFFYSIPEGKSAYDIDKYFGIIMEEIEKIDWQLRPDLLYNLANGTRYRFEKFPRTMESEELGITLLVDPKDSKMALNLRGDAITRNTLQLMNFDGSDLTLNQNYDAIGIPDLKNKSNIIAVIGKDLDRDPLSYPSCQIKGKIYFIDIYRGFIQFMEMVNDLLNVSTSNKKWNIGDYLGKQYLKAAGYRPERGIE